MNEINDEIKLTLSLMQAAAYEGANNELQYHLACLLEMKRNMLEQRLTIVGNGVDTDTDTWDCLSGVVFDEPGKPLTTEELKGGAWWCGDTSEECRLALVENGIDTVEEDCYDNAMALFIYKRGHESHINRADMHIEKFRLKQIHRIGNEFYWSEK